MVALCDSAHTSFRLFHRTFSTRGDLLATLPHPLLGEDGGKRFPSRGQTRDPPSSSEPLSFAGGRAAHQSSAIISRGGTFKNISMYHIGKLAIRLLYRRAPSIHLLLGPLEYIRSVCYNTAMALQDLVLDALSGDTQTVTETHTALGNLRGETAAGVLLHEGQSALSRMQDLRDREFHFQASLVASMFLSWGRSDRRGRWSLSEKARSPMLVGSVLFARSADYLQTGSEEERQDILRFVKQSLDNHFLETMLRDPSDQIARIEEVWGEDTVSLLARFGKVKDSTAKRWVGGASPASAAGEIRRTAEILYHLQSSAGISGKEARLWMEEPLEGGPTALACIEAGNSPRITGQEIELDPLTQKLESEGIYAFSWVSRDMAR